MHTTWKEENNALVKTFEFSSFTNAMVFVNKVADIAEEIQHHPRIQIEYITVTLTLSTHETGGTITDRDRELATRIDMLL
jgi:4a-hydroxytetrahydrobiopterin dehydratase